MSMPDRKKNYPVKISQKEKNNGDQLGQVNDKHYTEDVRNKRRMGQVEIAPRDEDCQKKGDRQGNPVQYAYCHPDG